MSIEAKVLGAIAHSSDVYRTLAGMAEDQDFSDQGLVIFKEIADFYERDGTADKVDTDLLCHALERKYPKHGEILQGIVHSLEDVSLPNVKHEFLSLKKQMAADRLSSALVAGDDAKIAQFKEEYERVTSGLVDTEEDNTYIGAPVDSIISSVSPDQLIKLYPQQLNEALEGGCPRGSHVLVFAPPEMGKSMVCINMASCMIHEGRRVLYIGNEDPATMMLLRFYSRLSGMTRAEILKEPKVAEKKAFANGYSNLTFVSLSPGTVPDVRRLVRRHSPDILFVDQLSNIYSKNASKVEKLEYLASEVRNIVKAANIVGVSVTQAGESAQNKQVLELGDVYFSNVAIQAAVDVMIGVGGDKQLVDMGKRTLSLCKNKISGNHMPVYVDVNTRMSMVT